MVPRGVVLHTVAVKGDASAASIRRYHVQTLGWLDIGYHFVIRKNGTVEPGRPTSMTGAHTEGANDTLGVVVCGDGDSEPWTLAQRDAVFGLLDSLCRAHGWSEQAVCGHREAPARLAGAKPVHKTCPGRLVDLDAVRAELGRRLASSDAGR